MSDDSMQNQWAQSYLSGGSMAYVDTLYEDYLSDPLSIPEQWRNLFDGLPPVDGVQHDFSHQAVKDYFLDYANTKQSRNKAAVGNGEVKQASVTKLINEYRAHGHHLAQLDPLAMRHKLDIPSLKLAHHHLSDKDLDTLFVPGASLSQQKMTLRDIKQAMEQTYCGSIGIEYMHISDENERVWIQHQMESVRACPQFSKAKRLRILNELTQADGLERYLGSRYVGQKRFSLEGGDSLIPMMKELILCSGDSGVKEMVIGMAHRGRLNVLVNVLGKSPEVLFQEFEGKSQSQMSGDVKYHMGFSSDVKVGNNILHLALAFNPSHLEIIGPVVQGSVRSRMRRRDDLDDKNSVLPVVIHGDAAFAGQGVVMETFNFSQARGYCTGGTVHIVINNQIGFTTSNPLDARSTLYCTDVAKIVQAPVLHVNGDDPEAVVFATKLAFDFRAKFKRDIVLDLVCYRRHGHNEADEPLVTQPVMYQKIKKMPTPREIYAQRLQEEGVIQPNESEHMVAVYRDILDKGETVVETVQGDYADKIIIDWEPHVNAPWDEEVDTGIDAARLTAMASQLATLPEGFTVHPVVKRLLNERDKMTAGEIPLNWGYAETLAYASLVSEDYGVRLSGQDSGRGTFAHRHAVLHDYNTAECYVPLEHLATHASRPFYVIDSVLSEEAVLAFEYGFASSEPNTLVLWEAQFGDFANGAQVVIDQFISSGEQKWGRMCGLVMLLPHGFEGQGPEHSSARLERYMQLCAQHNMQVCVPTTPAQMFHVLRRQMIRKYRKPLIVMTPKSLLRHKLAVSQLEDLTQGKFHLVIPEVDNLIAEQVQRVIVCSGKVYYDLLQQRRKNQQMDTAIIRLEQLYPFPHKELSGELSKYPNASHVVWCQEEPQNQGAWFSIQHNLLASLADKQRLAYAGRGFFAAPAVGSPGLHNKQQQTLISQALGYQQDPS